MDGRLNIKFVGTGGAFDSTLVNSSAVVQHGDQRLLLDCGHSVFPALVRNRLPETLDGVIITHMHDDHVGSLGTLVYYHAIVLQRGRLPIYYPSEVLLAELRSFLGLTVRDVDERVEFRPLSSLHGVGSIDTTGRHMPGMATYGYHFTNGQRSVVYSGDNGDADYLLSRVKELGLPFPTIFHEVFFLGRIHSHAYYQDLETWLDRFPIYGYHCDHRTAPADLKLPLVAQQSDLVFEP